MFDFFNQETYTQFPGGVVNANGTTFPATVANGMTMAYIILGPCAILPLHLHPRGANFVVAIEGETETFMILENGARTVRTTLTPGKMTVFPTGSIHSMQNKGCGNATLISALNSEDAGTHNIVNGLFGLPRELVSAAFGTDVLSEYYSAPMASVPAVGTGANTGPNSYLVQCGLDDGG